MTRLSRLALALALAVCLPAALPSGAAAAKPKYPSITKVSPMQLGLGDTLTVRGKNFRSGKGRNTVVFKRDGGRAVFVKAGKATKTQLSVIVPATMLSALSRKSGKSVATRFRVHVLAGRFGRRFTTVKSSPVIAPAARGASGGVTGPVATGPSRVTSPAAAAAAANANDCDNDRVPDVKDADDDNDLLSDELEARLKTKVCGSDTDGDTITDGYEYQSAIDLNSAAVPFPGKRAYANPLDGEDAANDFDGDGLTLTEEYGAWRFSGSPTPLSYSDGSLYTGGKGAAVADDDPRDTDGSRYLSDDERDVDADGLTNWDEAHGRMTPNWWALSFTDPRESVYPGRTFEATSFAEADTDGDTIPDGADDEDHDGFTNAFEVERPRNWRTTYVSTSHPGTDPRARVNPFNPCKPLYSSTCHRYAPFGYYQDGEDWESPIRQDGP